MVDRFIESKHPPCEVIVHPIVLLSVADHYARVAKGTSKRVVGTLLGEVREGKLHVLTSFAVPFEEDKDPKVFFYDHMYHEDLAAMHKKVNIKEKIVGWYSTGPKIKPSDIQIHEMYRKYTLEPIFVILDVQPNAHDLPMEAYYAVAQKTHEENFTRTFKSIPSTFDADEAEEIGTEHLLRDIKNASASTLASRVSDKKSALRLLISKIKEITSFLEETRSGKYAYNMGIMDMVQDLFNELPELDGQQDQQFLAEEVNDHHLGIYVGSLLRTLVALHSLTQNKIRNRKLVADMVREKNEKASEKDAEKEKEAEKEKKKEAKAKGA